MTEPEIFSMKELQERYLAHRKKMDTLFEHHEDTGHLTLKVVDDYDVRLAPITDKGQLLEWVHHLSEKSWMTPFLISEFINRVYAIKGWKREGVPH